MLYSNAYRQTVASLAFLREHALVFNDANLIIVDSTQLQALALSQLVSVNQSSVVNLNNGTFNMSTSYTC